MHILLILSNLICCKMAIPTTSDWSLTCINNNGGSSSRRGTTTHKKPPLLYPTSKLIHFSSNFRALIPNSSTCQSTFLEDQTCKTPNSSSSTLIELDSKPQDYQHFPVVVVPGGTEDLNATICTLLKDPQTEHLAFDCYQRAKQTLEFRPEKSALKQLIRHSIRSKNWSWLLSLSEDLGCFNVFPDVPTCCGMVTSCIKARKFTIAARLLELFGTDKGIAVFAFDSAMKGYNKLHMYSSTVSVHERMKSAGVVLDPGCYCRVMEAYMKIGNTERVLSLFQEFQRKNTTTDCNDSMKSYTQMYRILCESLGKSGRAHEALVFFREMKEKGIPEVHFIYSSLICAFAAVREVKEAEELFKEAESKKMLRDPALFLKLILMYIEEGLLEKTLEIVESMENARIRVSDCIFCAVVNGFSKKRGLRAAAKVYEDLVSKGCEPGQVTYASIINVYCRLGLYSKAEKKFSEMRKKGFDKCVVAYSNMVAMYGKTGRLRDAMRLVAKMKERGCEPNVWIYNSLLDMQGKVMNLRQIEKVWKEMKRRKVGADKVSYTSVITAYSKAREFETCVRYYDEYRMNGGKIDRAMGGIMVGVFSKMSRIDDLVKLLQDMRSEGTGLDGRLYRSALNALRDAGLQIQAKWLQEGFSGVS